MTFLSVLVRQGDAVLIDRLVPLRPGLVLGDHVEAAVAFPGGVFRVEAGPRGWRLDGRALVRGRPLRLSLADVEVVVETSHAAADLPEGLPDLRVLVATAAIVLAAATWDAALGLLSDEPELASELAALVGSASDEEALQDTGWSDPRDAWPPPVSLGE